MTKLKYFSFALILVMGACSGTNEQWQQHYSPEVAYYNTTNDSVSVYSEPGSSSSLIYKLAPNDGGFIKTCTQNFEWCKLQYGSTPQSGWVEMKYLEGHAD